MSTTDIAPETVADVPTGSAADEVTGSALASLASWFTSSDSKVIGRNFIACALLALAGAAVLGVILGAERIDGGDALIDEGSLLQLFVAFRIALVFGALVPLLLGLAVAVVPLQVGARSLAFPRLAAAGFWAWLTGLVLVFVALGQQRWSRRGRRGHGRPVHRRPRTPRHRARCGLGDRRRDRADHTRARGCGWVGCRCSPGRD